MSVYPTQALAVEAAKALGERVHVMGERSAVDVMRAPNEFVCTAGDRWWETDHPHVEVVFHSECTTVGSEWICMTCGAMSGDLTEDVESDLRDVLRKKR